MAPPKVKALQTQLLLVGIIDMLKAGQNIAKDSEELAAATAAGLVRLRLFFGQLLNTSDTGDRTLAFQIHDTVMEENIMKLASVLDGTLHTSSDAALQHAEQAMRHSLN